MEYSAVLDFAGLPDFECLVTVCFGEDLGPCANKLDRLTDGSLRELLSGSGLTDKPAGCEWLSPVRDVLPRHILLIQLGERAPDHRVFGKAIITALDRIQKSGIQSAVFCISDALDSSGRSKELFYQSVVTLCELSSYRYPGCTFSSSPASSLKQIAFLLYSRNTGKKFVDTGIQNGTAIGCGMNFARQLSDLPANFCTPGYLAEQAVSLGKSSGVDVTVFEEQDMKKLGMGCILGVSRGSAQPAKFIVIEYSGVGCGHAPIVLIGKGVTFDSGGLSIKSAGGMDEMKFDMCGAASVLGTIQAVSELGLQVNVVGLVPCSENLIDGGAFKPGDVLTSLSGQTVEILSTDAEGRLLIADALTYAQRYNPAILIDVATLTGACITALGHDLSGLFTNDQKLASRLAQAGEDCQDHAWRLPVLEEYEEQLQSNFADLASSAGRSGDHGAGASVAACFLARFAGQSRWAHLDVAGTAWTRGKAKGATGRPVALLSQFLINYCARPF